MRKTSLKTFTSGLVTSLANPQSAKQQVVRMKAARYFLGTTSGFEGAWLTRLYWVLAAPFAGALAKCSTGEGLWSEKFDIRQRMESVRDAFWFFAFCDFSFGSLLLVC